MKKTAQIISRPTNQLHRRCLRNYYYHTWHEFPLRALFHWVIFGVFVFGVGCGFVLQLWLIEPKFSRAATFIEDFTATTYKDAANTTAVWDTSSGTIKLNSYTEQLVNTTVNGTQQKPDVAADANGNFVVVWEDTNGYELYGQRFDLNGNKAGSQFQVNTSTTNVQYSPKVRMDGNGNFVAVWASSHSGSYRVYGQRFNSSGTKVGSEIQLWTSASGDLGGPWVAMNASGNFVAVWSKSQAPGGIWAQRFDANGNKVGSQLTVSSEGGNPRAAMSSSGSFVVGFTKSSGGYTYSFVQRYDSSGNAVGSLIQANTTTGSHQSNPDIAMDPNGNFIVVWSGTGQNDTSGAVLAQRFDASGNKVGSEFRVNIYTANSQGAPAVSMDSSGNFVVAWNSYGEEGLGSNNVGIYAKRYNSSGAAQAPSGSQANSDAAGQYYNGVDAARGEGYEFRVNGYLTNNQNNPDVAIGGNGNAIITWMSNGQDGSNSGIYAQRFNSTGAALWTSPIYYGYPANVVSTTVVNTPAVSATLTSTQTTPANTSITYYLSNGYGASEVASYYNAGATSSFYTEAGQSFAATTTASVNAVKVYMRQGWPSTYTVKLFSTESDLINNTNALATTTSYTGDPTTSAFQPIVFTFGSPVNLVQGNTYYLYVNVGWNASVQYDSSGAYADGQYYANRTTPQSAYDMNFFVGTTYDGTFQQIAPGQELTFSGVGSDLRWKAVLNTTDASVAPTISALQIVTVSDTTNPAANITADLAAQPNAGDTTVTISGSFTEINPNTNDFYVAINSGVYGSATSGDANTAVPANQVTAIGAALDGNDYITGVKIVHTDDFNNVGTNENTDIAVSKKYVKPYQPIAPTVGNAAPTAVDIAVNQHASAAADLKYAIYDATVGQYVQTDGALGNGAVWKTIIDWGTITVSGLSAPASGHTFQTKSYNSSDPGGDINHNAASESSLSAAASAGNTAPSGGYTEADIIPSEQLTFNSATGSLTVNFRIQDIDLDNITLKTFQSSVNNNDWQAPTDGDSSLALGTGWSNNNGSDYFSAVDFSGAVYSFTFNTQSAGIVPGASLRVRFKLNDGTTDSNFLTSGSIILNSPPVLGYTQINLIPAVAVATDGSGLVTINFKTKDTEGDDTTLKTLEYSLDNGNSWNAPANNDNSQALLSGWNNNSGFNYGSAPDLSSAQAHSFTLNTKHADVNIAVDVAEFKVRFKANDSIVDSDDFAVSAAIALPNQAPTISSVQQKTSYDPGGKTIDVTFSEAIEQITAVALANYSVTDVGQPSAANLINNNTVRLVFSNPVIPGLTDINISGIKDLNNNTITTVTDYNINTEGTYSSGHVSIIQSIPVTGATNVSRHTAIRAYFDADLSATTVTSNNVRLTADGNQVAGSINSSAAGRYIEFVPTVGTLTGNKIYTFTITAGVKDIGGRSLSADWSINFSTESEEQIWGDYMMPPYVTSISPINGSTNVSTSLQKVVINFSKVMNSSTFTTSNIILSPAVSDATVNASTDGQRAYINVGGKLAASQTYSINVTTGVRANNGMPLGSLYTASLTTAAPMAVETPSVPPQVVGTSVNQWRNSVNCAAPDYICQVPVNLGNGFIGVSYDRDLDITTVSAANVYLKDAANNTVAGTVDYATTARSIRFIPNSVLSANTVYTLTNTTGIVSNTGTALAANYTLTFTTISQSDNEAPAVAMVDADTTGLVMSFTEGLNSASATNYSNYNLEVRTAGSEWQALDLSSANLTYHSVNNEVRFEGVNGLAAGAEFRLTPTANVTDLAGNTLATTAITGYLANTASMTEQVGGSTLFGETRRFEDFTLADHLTNAFTPVDIFPINNLAGQTSNYIVNLPITSQILAGGKIILTFPAGFNVSVATQNTNSTLNRDINGAGAGAVTINRVNVVGQVVTVVLGSVPTQSSDFLSFALAGIINASEAREVGMNGYTIELRTRSSGDMPIEGPWTSNAFFIRAIGSYTLSGNIKHDNGTPANTTDDASLAVAGVKVVLGSPTLGSIEKTTDANGAFSFTEITAGNYMLFTDASVTSGGVDYIGSPIPQSIYITGNTTFNPVFAKTGGVDYRVITVNVSGVPSGETVEVFANTQNRAVSKNLSANGSVQLQLSSGEYYIGVRPHTARTGYQGSVATVDAIYPAPIARLINANTEISLTIQQVADSKIVGYVYSDDNNNNNYDAGEGVANAKVWVYNPANINFLGVNTTTNAGGYYELLVPPGIYTVGANAPGLSPIRGKQATVSSTTTVNFKVSKPVNSVTITGRVLDGTAPIQNASVWAYQTASDFSTRSGAHLNANTNSKGEFTLFVSPNTYWVTGVFADGYGDFTKNNITAGSASLANQNFTAATLNTVSGSVTVDGNAIANANVWADRYVSGAIVSGNRTTTQQDGSYDLMLPDGYYKIRAFSPVYGEFSALPGSGYLDVDADSSNSSAETSSGINFALSNTGVITITLKDSGGNNYSASESFEAFVEVKQTSGTREIWNRARILGSNNTTINVPQGNDYRVSVFSAGYGELAVAAGSSAVITNLGSAASSTFIVPTAVGTTITLSGTVKDLNNNAVAGAWVWLAPKEASENSRGRARGIASDANGSFSFTVPRGVYILGADKPGYVTADTVEVSSDATTRFVLTAATGSISGSVYRGSGFADPVGGAYVWAKSTDNKFVNTTTEPNGQYTLAVGVGTWIIEARHDGYETTGDNKKEVVIVAGQNIEASDAVSGIHLTAISGYTIQPPKVSSVVPATGGVLRDENSNVQITVPANALGTNTNAGTMTIRETTSVPETSNGRPANNQGYEITAVDADGAGISTLLGSITIRVPYDDDPENEDNYQLAYYSNSANAWVTVAGFANDTENNVLTGAVNHLTIFAPVIPPATANIAFARKVFMTPDAPSNVRYATNLSSITLEWDDPVDQNLYQILIFRNAGGFTPIDGVPHTVIPAGKGIYLDTNVEVGQTYKYILRAKDKSGNIDKNVNVYSVKVEPEPTQAIIAQPTQEVFVESEEAKTTIEPTIPDLGIKPGQLIKSFDKAVYYYGPDGKKYLFPEAQVFFTWYEDFSNVATISSVQMDSIASGGQVLYRPGVKLIKTKNSPKVYAVAKGGSLRWIETEALAKALYGADWNRKINDIAQEIFDQDYQIGDPIQKVSQYDPGDQQNSARDIAENQGLLNLFQKVKRGVSKVLEKIGF